MEPISKARTGKSLKYEILDILHKSAKPLNLGQIRSELARRNIYFSQAAIKRMLDKLCAKGKAWAAKDEENGRHIFSNMPFPAKEPPTQ